MAKKFNELFIGKEKKIWKNKISSVWTFLVHKGSHTLIEEVGVFELLYKNNILANGEYELIKRPIIVGNKPEYKKIQILGQKFQVEPKFGYEKQIHLFNIKSQKAGCGSMLMENIIKWAKESSKKTLWLDVLKDNQRAISLYTKFGFQIDEQYDKLANVSWYRMYNKID